MTDLYFNYKGEVIQLSYVQEGTFKEVYQKIDNLFGDESIPNTFDIRLDVFKHFKLLKANTFTDVVVDIIGCSNIIIKSDGSVVLETPNGLSINEIQR